MARWSTRELFGGSTAPSSSLARVAETTLPDSHGGDFCGIERLGSPGPSLSPAQLGS